MTDKLSKVLAHKAQATALERLGSCAAQANQMRLWLANKSHERAAE
jgi:hypothetical protein